MPIIAATWVVKSGMSRKRAASICRATPQPMPKRAVITALFGIGCGVALQMLAARFLDMPDFTTQVAAMIGIGVGIDYALFIVTRYRQGLHDGLEPAAAISRALDTSGRA